MTSAAEHAATVREALTKHHAVGYTVAWGARCEVCDRHEPFAALDALEAQAEDMANWQEAARRRQERAEELEAALRQIAEEPPPQAWADASEIARAALDKDTP